MALFKIFNNFGSTTKTISDVQTHTEGYCYFDVTTNKFYIDTSSTSTGLRQLNGTFYGECDTPAGTATKIVNNIPGFALTKGVSVLIKFTEGNSAGVADLKLKFSESETEEAKPIKYANSDLNAANAIIAGGIYQFVYDGANWLWTGQMNTNTDTKVTQTATTTSANYEILFSGTADNTSRTETARKTSTLTYNPSTKALSTSGPINGFTLAEASSKSVSTTITNSTTASLPTVGAVKTYVDNAFAVNDAMIFKGTISDTDTHATTNTLPVPHNAGWTYKVITSTTYTYAGQKCEEGDMIVCIADGTTASNADWTVIQTNTDGTVVGPATSTTNAVAIYTGTTGKAIQDSSVIINDGNIIPQTNGSKNLGSTTQQWANVYSTTFHGNLNGTANKAINDSDGNAINSTYLKLSGGSMTGGITFKNQSSAYNEKGLLFTKGTRIGENTSGDLGIYAVNNIHIRPGSTSGASSDGISISTTSIIPTNNNTTLGTSTNKWTNVYSTTFTGALNGNAESANSANSANQITRIQLSSDIDLNTLQDENLTHYYKLGTTAGGAINVPKSTTARAAFGLLVYSNAGGFRVQDLVSQNGRKYTRYYDNSNWSQWKEIAFTDSTIEYIVGSQTSATNVWTGKTKDTALYTGKIIAYKLPVGGNSSAATLNLTLADGTTTGAMAVKRKGTSNITTHYSAGEVIFMAYDGTNWQVNADYDSNTVSSAYCDTAASTAAKTASCNYWVANANSYLHFEFRQANSVQGAITMNVNSQGAKPIYINGTASSASNYTLPAGSYIAFYDGTNFQFRTDGYLPGLGTVGSASKWTTARTLSLTGAVTGSASIDGSGNVSLATSVNHTHTTSLATDTGTSTITLAHGGKYKLTAGGTSVIFTMPADNNTTYTAGTGLSLSGTTFNHSNSTTAQTTQAIYPIKIDAQGHISSYGTAVTPLTASSTLDATKLSGTIPTSCYTNTTYLSLAADPGGTAVSLVTTGEKDAWNNKATTDTKNTTGATDTSDTIYLIGAKSQGENPQTYSDNQIYAGNGTLFLAKTTSASATANNKPAIVIGGPSTGAHIEIDGSKILAKTSGTTAGTLYLQESTGAVQVNGTGGFKVGAYTIGAGTDDIGKRTIESSSTIYLKSGASILFQPSGTTSARINSDGNFYPETNDTLSIGTSAKKWNAMYATTFYGDLSGNSTNVTGTVAIANGGTGGTTVADANNNLQTWGLSSGTAIAANTNLNTLVSIGNYQCTLTNTAKTITNTPWGTGTSNSAVAFLLKIYASTGTTSNSYLKQVLIPYNTAASYVRWTSDTGTTWSTWQAMTSNQSQYVKKAGDTITGVLTISNTTASSSTSTGALKVTGGIGCGGNIYGAKVYGAVWNDYAEYRKDNLEEKELHQPGRCVYELGNGALALTDSRLQRGCEIISDTFGFAIGQDIKNGYNTPIASNGRVLAYLYEDIEIARNFIGWPVCSGPNGTVSIMTEEEENKYPSRIIGTISEIPDYEEWGTGKVKVNGRIWIRIK